MEGPKHHCAGPGAASDAATVTFQDFQGVRVCLILFLFLGAFLLLVSIGTIW